MNKLHQWQAGIRHGIVVMLGHKLVISMTILWTILRFKKREEKKNIFKKKRIFKKKVSVFCCCYCKIKR